MPGKTPIRYGKDNPLSNPEVQEKVRETNIIKYGSPFAKQKHFAKESIAIVNDPYKFEQFLLTCTSISDAATKLGLKEITIYKWRKRYNLQHINFSKVSPESSKIINDPIKLQAYLDKCISFREAFETLGVSELVLRNRRAKFGLTINKNNSYEQEIAKWLEDLEITFRAKDRHTLNKKVVTDGSRYKELDFLLPDQKIALEFNGDYWHMNPKFYLENDVNATSKRSAKEIWESDKRKADDCSSIGIRLITIWENDWVEDREEVKRLLMLEFYCK